MESIVFYVCPALSGGWSVFGSDIAPALSTFDARDEAVAYACDVADRLPLAEVQILGWGGAVDEYRACASLTGSRPAFSRTIGRPPAAIIGS